MQPSTLSPLASDTTADASDQQLIAHALHGEEKAFEAIMRRYNRLLFRAARGVISNDADAQDVVQETYLRAFTRLQDFKGGSTLGTWLVRIAINAASDVLRKRSRSVPTDSRQMIDLEPLAEHMMAFSTPQNKSPEATAARGELRSLLESAIGQLPPIYRSVFIFRAVQGLSVNETAHCLQVSDDVIRTRYLRARALMRDALGAQVEEHVESAFSFAGERCDRVVHHVVAELKQHKLITPG